MNLSNDKLLNFKLNLILIHDTYSDNAKFINNKADIFVKKFNDFTKNDDGKVSSGIHMFAEMTISYSLFQSAITQMYHSFDQYVRILFNIDYSIQDFRKVIKEIKKYNYDIEKNTYFELIDKYRLLNNAIKHGRLDELEKKYPSYINDKDTKNEFGTILDNKLNINSEDVDECCSCLLEYVDEMSNYLEDMGFFDR